MQIDPQQIVAQLLVASVQRRVRPCIARSRCGPLVHLVSDVTGDAASARTILERWAATPTRVRLRSEDSEPGKLPSLVDLR